MKTKSVRVKVPATTANIGAGFDTLGIACSLYSEIELKLFTKEHFSITILGDGKDELTSDRDNLVFLAVKKFLGTIGEATRYRGIELILNNQIPLARGLGSSAAAIVGGLSAANFYFNSPLSKNQLLNLATELEGHSDNVAPAIYGGFTISMRLDKKVSTLSFLPKIPLKLIFAVPDFSLATDKSRSVLPHHVSIEDAIFNIGRATTLVAALATGNKKALVHAFADRMHQPYREKLLPYMTDVFNFAKKEGAIGSTLSGAGSSIVAFATENEKAIGNAMHEALQKYQLTSKIFILDIVSEGAVLVKKF